MKKAIGALFILIFGACLIGAQERSLDTFIQSMATSARDSIERGGAKAVAVVELGSAQKKTGGDIGALGKYIASALQGMLVSLPDRKFQVVDRLNLERILREQEFQLSGLADSSSSARIGSLLSCDTLITGDIELSSLVLVNLNLLSVEKGTVLGSVQKRIPMTTDVKALLGIDYEDPAIIKELTPAGIDFPYYVRIKTWAGPKMELFAEGKRYIMAKPNEEYAIEIENRTDKAVGVALFVDGINTAFMRRQTPKDAVKWIIYPKQTVSIEGWQVDASTARRLVFAGKDESLAAKRGFSEEVGLISAVFFDQQESLTRGGQEAGTAAGEAFGATVKTVEMRLETTPAMIFNIWYDYRNGLKSRGIQAE